MYEEVIANSKTILWNGPMGVFEMSNFEHGTKAAAEAIDDTGKPPWPPGGAASGGGRQ